MPTGAPRFFLRCLAAIFALLLWASAAPADIIDCRRPGEDTRYTVYLDEPAYANPVFRDDTQMQTFMERLWFFLDQDRDRRWVEHTELPVGFAFCLGRQPSLDGREFDAALVDLLYNKGVLLEIWGTLDARSTNGTLVDRQARIGYLLVPLEFIARSEGGPSGKFFVRYPEDPGTETQDFLEFFRDTTDLDAFIAVSLGIKALRSGNFPLAQGNLCRAKLMLEHQVSSGLASGRRKARLEELAQFAGDAAGRAILAAQQESGAPSPLDLLDPAKPCPEENSP